MPTASVPLSVDPFKAHILHYDYSTDEDYHSEDDHDFDDEDWADLEEEYERKEDEDIAVFRAIVDNLPIESLLHLLQGHVKAMQKEGKLTTTVEVYDDKDSHQQQQDEANNDVTMSQDLQQKEEPMQIEKQFRWATEEDCTVKRDIHKVDAMKGHRDLWFSGAELLAIRQDLVRQIRFFNMHHQERIETLDRVVCGDGSEPVIEECIKEMTRHSIGRGLEGHISRLIPQTRRQHVWSVLNAQMTCNYRNFKYDERIEVLREQSLINGQMMLMYAHRMAKSDEIEALTASMSRWEPTEAFA